MMTTKEERRKTHGSLSEEELIRPVTDVELAEIPDRLQALFYAYDEKRCLAFNYLVRLTAEVRRLREEIAALKEKAVTP